MINFAKRAGPLLLVAVLFFSILPLTSVFAEGGEGVGEGAGGAFASGDVVSIASLDALPEETLWQGYDLGEIESQADLVLPDTLTGMDTGGNAISIVGVTWECSTEFDPLAAVDPPGYEFTAVLPQGYALGEGVTAPVVTVFMREDMGPGGISMLAGVIPRFDTALANWNASGHPWSYGGASLCAAFVNYAFNSVWGHGYSTNVDVYTSGTLYNTAAFASYLSQYAKSGDSVRVTSVNNANITHIFILDSFDATACNIYESNYNGVNNAARFTWISDGTLLGDIFYNAGRNYSTGFTVQVRHSRNNGSSPASSVFGNLEAVSGGVGQITIGGWAIDSHVPTQPMAIHVYIGGPSGAPGAEGNGSTVANQYRPDVAAAHPGTGNYHGFANTITTSKRGTQTVYVYAVGSQSVLLGSMTVTISDHTTYGSFDMAAGGAGEITVRGWAIDSYSPTQPIGIHVYIGGPSGSSVAEGNNSIIANQYRPDVGAAYPGTGNHHGFHNTISTSKRGTQTIYVYSVGSKSAFLGSKTVVINAPAPTPTNPVITINSQPAPSTSLAEGYTSGGGLSVSARVTQGAVLSYQWYSNTTESNVGGTLIPGATDMGYTLPTGLTEDKYYYFCEISATGGAASVRSDVATVDVKNYSLITSHPQGSVVAIGAPGDTYNLTVEAQPKPGGTLSYQWFAGSFLGLEVAISGAVDAVYAAPIDVEGTTYYSVTVTNTPDDGGDPVSDMSIIVALTVSGRPSISGPYDMMVFEGYDATSTDVFTITGSDPLVVSKLFGVDEVTWNAEEKKLDVEEGLAAGRYPVTLTASNGTVPNASFSFTLIVEAPTHGISLSPDEDVTFPAATYGYTAQQPHSVTVNPTGNQPVGTLSIALSGANSDAFTLSKTSMDTLGESFTVVPKTDLDAGTYTATVTVSGNAGVAAQSLALRFTVNKADLPAPAAPTLNTKSATGITINGTTPAMEYACVTGSAPDSGDWKKCEAETAAISDLAPDTAYNIFLRYSGDTNHNPSAASSPALVVTTDAAPPGPEDEQTPPGPEDHTLRTLTDGTTGVAVTGRFSDDAVLSISDTIVHAAGSCVACDEIRAQQNADNVLVLCEISATGHLGGEVTVHIPVDRAYEGQDLAVLHCANGEMEVKVLTVQNGAVTGSFSSLSPFAVMKPTYQPPPSAPRFPQTNDSAGIGIWFVVGLSAIACLILFAYLKKQRAR